MDCANHYSAKGYRRSGSARHVIHVHIYMEAVLHLLRLGHALEG
ncbi:hypothetical protein SRABI26_04633 [Arthrobacter sp. Bi26]|nr:hypothetical protein SRABI26_04633 [Arthrobacter sp. Bi26]